MQSWIYFRSGELRKARPASGKASQGLKDLL